MVNANTVKHPRLSKTWHGLAAFFAGGLGIFGIMTLVTRNIYGIIMLAGASVYFYIRHQAKTSVVSNKWTIVGGVLGALFIIGGLIFTGLAILFAILLATWGSGSGGSK